jgi:hypothetical protein
VRKHYIRSTVSDNANISTGCQRLRTPLPHYLQHLSYVSLNAFWNSCDVNFADSDFTEEGFTIIIEYLYTGAVVGVTCGILDCDKLQATLQAAQYFNLTVLHTAARRWAQTSSATVEESDEDDDNADDDDV